jgi:hypothetical protein
MLIRIAVFALLSFCSVVPLHAEEKAKPAKMSREDLLDIQNTQFQFADMDRAISAIQERAKVLRAHRDEVLKKYGLKVEDLGKSASIDEDGTIKRAEPSKTKGGK